MIETEVTYETALGQGGEQVRDVISREYELSLILLKIDL